MKSKCKLMAAWSQCACMSCHAGTVLYAVAGSQG
jgi:hypothetical protein